MTRYVDRRPNNNRMRNGCAWIRGLLSLFIVCSSSSHFRFCSSLLRSTCYSRTMLDIGSNVKRTHSFVLRFFGKILVFFFSYFPCSHKYINSWMYSNEIENIRHLPQASSKRQNNKLNVDAERILSRCERCVLCGRTRTLISYYDCYEDNAIQFIFFTFLRFILTIIRNSSFMEL